MNLRSKFAPQFASIVIVLSLSLLLTRVYLHQGIPYTHDGQNHVARFANYWSAIKEGQIPPRIAPHLFNHYGYPVFNYNYPLANILAVPFLALKLHPEIVFKLLMAGSFTVGLWGYAEWFFLTQQGKSRWYSVALIASSPFAYNLFLVRGTIGEVMALSLFPWLMISLKWITDRRFGFGHQLLLVSLWTAFWIAHNVSVLVMLPVILGAIWLELGQSYLAWRRWLICLLFSLGLVMWFWIPALAEKGLTVLDGAPLSLMAAQHSVNLNQLLACPLEFGFSYVGSIDSLAVGLGVGLVATLFVATLLQIKMMVNQRKIPVSVVYWLVVAVCSIVGQLGLFAFWWRIIPLVSFIQFPWRLTLISLIALAWLSNWLSTILKFWPKLALSLAAIQILIVIRSTTIGYVHWQPIEYLFFPHSTSTMNENLPKTYRLENQGSWQPSPEIITGSGEVEVQEWLGSRRSYSLLLTEPSTIVEPTMVFAGWQTNVTTDMGTPKRISFYDDDVVRGRLAYQLPAGSYQVTSSFTQWTWPRIFGNGLTLMTMIIGGLYLLALAKQVFPLTKVKK